MLRGPFRRSVGKARIDGVALAFRGSGAHWTGAVHIGLNFSLPERAVVDAHFEERTFRRGSESPCVPASRPATVATAPWHPRELRDEVLERLVRGGFADLREHCGHRLAGAGAQQPVDVLAQRHVLCAMTERSLNN